MGPPPFLPPLPSPTASLKGTSARQQDPQGALGHFPCRVRAGGARLLGRAKSTKIINLQGLCFSACLSACPPLSTGPQARAPTSPRQNFPKLCILCIGLSLRPPLGALGGLLFGVTPPIGEILSELRISVTLQSLHLKRMSLILDVVLNMAFLKLV